MRDLCAAFRDGRVPNSMDDDRYFNVRRLKRTASRLMSRKIAVVTGGAGFIGSHMVDLLLDRGFAVRVIDNLGGGHRSNLAHSKDNPKLACHWQDIRTLEADAAVFTGAKYVFHFAGIGDIVPSIEKADRIHGRQRPGHRARARVRARGQR